MYIKSYKNDLIMIDTNLDRETFEFTLKMKAEKMNLSKGVQIIDCTKTQQSNEQNLER